MTRKSVTAVLLAGALLGALSGCTSDGSKDPAPPAARAPEAPTDVPLKTRIRPPGAFTNEKGWEVEADWIPKGLPFPYALSAKGDAVAYLDRTERGYVLKVREAASGRLRSTGRPWKAPDPAAGRAGSPSGELTVPRVSLITGGEREYFAVWAFGERRKDRLHEAGAVVSAAFYPADASGDAAPSGTADVKVPGEEDVSDHVSVFPGARGLLVEPAPGDFTLLSPDGKAGPVAPEVSLGGASSGPDINAAFPGPDGLVTNGELKGRHFTGGFGVDGGWYSAKVTPPGVGAESRDGDSEKLPNGRIISAVGGRLVAGWYTPAGEPLSAVHDLSTGKVRATAPCENVGTAYDLRVPELADQYDTPAAISPNGRYLVEDGSVFDLTTGKGHCVGQGEDAKEINLTAVGDDGTAYGLTEEDAQGYTPVSVSAATGAVKALPAGYTPPDAVARGAGVFVTDNGTSRHLIVLSTRN